MIYLMRHGLDDETLIGGHSNAPLIEEGIKEVEVSSKFIQNQKLHINKIYTSDITRALQTATIINRHLNLEIIQKEYLRELDKGALTGLPKEYAKKYYKEYLEINSLNQKYPNGESMLDFYKRIKSSLDMILKEDNTLIVTYRGVINMVYFILNNEELSLDKEKFNVSPASIHEYNPNLKLIKRVY